MIPSCTDRPQSPTGLTREAATTIDDEQAIGELLTR
jgi:hypothetical protein